MAAADPISNFINSPVFFPLLGLIIAAVLGFKIISMYQNRQRYVSRSAIQKSERVALLKETADTFYNGSWFKGLFHGKKRLGTIIGISPLQDEKTGSTTIEIAYIKAGILNSILANFMNRNDVLRVADNDDICHFNVAQKHIIIYPWIAIDDYFGTRYDVPNGERNRNLIKENVFKTDFENLGSIYYAQAQKQSTIDPDKAHEIMKQQMQLQIERQKSLEKRS